MILFDLNGVRTRRAALFGVSALFLAIGCPQPGRSQQAAPPSVSVVAAQEHSAPSQQALDASADAHASTLGGLRKGTLFYATAPLSEEALRKADKTPAGVSFTLPLMVDRKQNRLFVQVLVNNQKIRLFLDTAGGPYVSLNQASAHGIELTGEAPVQIGGVQGYEAQTQGLAKSLTLGNLTLQQIAMTVSRNGPPHDGTLGLGMFEHYRVTLDFAANTMTLKRGGVLVPPPGGGASLSIPFDDDDGYLFLPVRILGQAGWALLDSGSDVNALSFKAAKAAAVQLPSSDSKTVPVDQKIGAGDTAKKLNVIGLKAPVPISMDVAAEGADFSTTSQLGMSNIDDVLDAAFDTHMVAKLGFPFLLQFQRVIIDYPTHTLILQHPAHDTFIKVTLAPTNHDKPWPGYKWRQKGYAWIEVPDVKGTPLPLLTLILPTLTTPTQTTKAVAKTVVFSPPGNGSITISVNGAASAFPLPPESIIRVDTDGSIHVLPPGSRSSGVNDHSFYIGPLDGPGK